MVTSPRAGLFLRDMPVNPRSDKKRGEVVEEGGGVEEEGAMRK